MTTTATSVTVTAAAATSPLAAQAAQQKLALSYTLSRTNLF